MAYKIFVSYKYWDTSVYQDNELNLIKYPGLLPYGIEEKVTPRSYLDEMSNILQDNAIEKWEQEGEDLSQFKDTTIASKLRDKIYDSSITIVLISPHMKDNSAEDDQWIPWEVAYSLRNSTRNGRTSQSNALIAVVLPDIYNRYDYCIEHNFGCGINILKFSDRFCFTIIGANFFNKKDANRYECPHCGEIHYRGSDNHYFSYAKWEDFKQEPMQYINSALEHQKVIDEYTIHGQVIL